MTEEQIQFAKGAYKDGYLDGYKEGIRTAKIIDKYLTSEDLEKSWENSTCKKICGQSA